LLAGDNYHQQQSVLSVNDCCLWQQKELEASGEKTVTAKCLDGEDKGSARFKKTKHVVGFKEPLALLCLWRD